MPVGTSGGGHLFVLGRTPATLWTTPSCASQQTRGGGFGAGIISWETSVFQEEGEFFPCQNLHVRGHVRQFELWDSTPPANNPELEALRKENAQLKKMLKHLNDTLMQLKEKMKTKRGTSPSPAAQPQRRSSQSSPRLTQAPQAVFPF